MKRERDADEPVGARHLRDILGKYFRKVLGWHGPVDIDPPVSAVTVERHQTDDPDVTKYVARDAEGVAASIRVRVVRSITADSLLSTPR